MSQTTFAFFKSLFEELEPDKLKKRFLELLLESQQADRGSIWVKHKEEYVCAEAAGRHSGRIKGVRISSKRPSLVGWVIEHGEMTIAEPTTDTRHFKGLEKGMDIKSSLILCLPLILKDGTVYGAVQIIDTSAGGDRMQLDQEYLDMLQAIVDVGSLALSNSLDLADQIDRNKRLSQSLQELHGPRQIIGQSPAFLSFMKQLQDYSVTDFPVLITGESGTGKELAAAELHRLSIRKGKPFFTQNCSAIPETLLESELFGYKKGAFTGADRDRDGLFKAADKGSIFLDEIGDMPINLQARILRVLQNGEVKPLGGNETHTVDVRVIAATNMDLKQAVQEKRFREDLFYRLNVLPLHLPPLREREEDIGLLLNFFLKREAMQIPSAPRRFSNEALEILSDYSWPGNIRELENFVKYLLATSQGDTITADDLPDRILNPSPEDMAAATAPVVQPTAELSARASVADPMAVFDAMNWEDMERTYISRLLEKNKWVISRAARQAGLKRSTFDSRMRKLGITKS